MPLPCGTAPPPAERSPCQLSPAILRRSSAVPVALTGSPVATCPAASGWSEHPLTLTPESLPLDPMTRTTPTVTITGLSGPRTVPAAWRGDRLAVNRPVLKDGLSTAPRTWVVTHLAIGYSMGTVSASQRAVIALAKAWDCPAAGLEALGRSRPPGDRPPGSDPARGP